MTTDNGRRIAFTKAGIMALQPPSSGDRVYFHDAKTATLTICVTTSGARTFYVYRRVQGKPQFIRLGRFPTMTVEQARKRAAIVNHDIDSGGDPLGDKRRIRGEATLQATFDRYLEVHAKPHKRTWEADQWMFNKYLDRWHARALSTITRADAARLHTRIGEAHGQYQANRVLALLTTLFGFAEAHGWEHPNPCKGVRRFAEQERERFLNAGELKQLFDALGNEPDRTIRDFVLLLLFTGQRRGAVQAMEWGGIDLGAAVWRVPVERSKNARPMTIPLGGPALAVLHERRKSAAPDAVYVLPSYGASGHICDTRTAWHRLVERAGLKDLRIHDLRRTFGSWQAAQGTSLLIIGKTLGHIDPSSAHVYGRLDIDPIRHAIEVATNAMVAAGGAKLLEAKEGAV